MKTSFSIELKFAERAFFFALLLMGLQAQSQNVANVYSVDLRKRELVYSCQVSTGDTTACVVEHHSDTCELLLYCHHDSSTRVTVVPFGGQCSSETYASICLRKSEVFSVKDGFVSVANSSQRGCYFSPNGTGGWYYIGRLGMDYAHADFVRDVNRTTWAVYYHHTFDYGPQGAFTTAFVRAEVDNNSHRVDEREVKIKHNKHSFDGLKVLRIMRRGYYSYVAFMQRGYNSIYLSVNTSGRWSYPVEFVSARRPLRMVDVQIARGRVLLLLMRGGSLELVEVGYRGDTYKIKSRQQILTLLTPINTFVKGCFVDGTKAMLVVD